MTIPAIESIMIPVGDMNWQMQFVQHVESAHAIRRRAHVLFERAKRAVEIAIEETEAAAMRFLAESL